MATDQEFVDFVLDQIENAGEITAKKMFGEYGIFSNGKIFALICDNKLYIKPTESGRAFIRDVVETPPYKGAKPSFLIEDKIESFSQKWLLIILLIAAFNIVFTSYCQAQTLRRVLIITGGHEFEKIIGGRYILTNINQDSSTYRHDVDVPVTVVDKNHPITKGMDDFVIHDEVYGNYKVLPSVQPLLHTTHPESGKIVGWTNNYGGSRIVYLQLGHDHYAYENPAIGQQFLKVIFRKD